MNRFAGKRGPGDRAACGRHRLAPPEEIGHDQAGFTLLEVMVAVAILAIALVTLIGSQSQSVSLAGLTRFDTTASLLAAGKMTELQLAGFDDLTDGEGDFGEQFAGYRWKVSVTDLTADDTGIEGSDNMLKRVDLTVSLVAEKDLSYTLREIMMRPVEAKQ
ncbi:type II secretion system minor pseudopilin GspI [Thermodesulfobacteriota bacterium B35]